MATDSNQRKNRDFLHPDSPLFLLAFHDLLKEVFNGRTSLEAAQASAYETLLRWAEEVVRRSDKRRIRASLHDIVVETVIRLANKDLDAYFDSNIGTIKRLVCGFMRNVVREWSRAPKVRWTDSLDLNSETCRASSPLESLICSEDLEQLRRAWEKISPLQRRAICRVYGVVFGEVACSDKELYEDQNRSRGLRRLSEEFEKLNTEQR